MTALGEPGRPEALARRAGTIAAALAALALLAAPAAAPAQQPQGQQGQQTQQGQRGQQGQAQNQRQQAGPPKLNARAWILIDALDHEVLAARNPGRPLPIASATKLMTARLALQRLRPGRRLRAARYDAAAIESQIGLRAGERLTVRDLLYALMLESANDAAATLAVRVSGSQQRFVAQMNRAAGALGLEDTSFANPIGFDAPDNHSSARDLVRLADLLLENPLFARIVRTPRVVLRSGATRREITTRNTLVLEKPWMVGVKTGHTLGARYVLVGAARRNGATLISAVLGAPSEAARDAETLKLLQYGFSQYRARRPVGRGEVLASPELAYRDERLPLAAARAVRASVRRGQTLDTQVEAPGEVDGPIEEGEAVGRVLVLVDGRVAGRSPLLATRAVAAASAAQRAVSTAKQPGILIPGGAFVIVVGLLLAIRGRRTAAEDPEAGEVEEPQAAEEARPRKEPKRRGARDRSPEERRRMHEERMRRRRERDS